MKFKLKMQRSWIIVWLIWLLLVILSSLISTADAQEFGDYVGHVIATDEDTLTVLTYTIEQGNFDNAFCFGDPRIKAPWGQGHADHTGDLYINNPEAVARYIYFELSVRVRDNGIPTNPESLDSKAMIYIECGKGYFKQTIIHE